MELHLPKNISKFFWTLFPFIFVLIASKNIFSEWELTNYGFNELEDLVRLFFVMILSACETALILVVIWVVKCIFKRLLKRK
ncbi:hypothetical protein IM538_13030 [Cytobacillus suaedae]|nr:hypothetical protein IM538_13030 [Cytobacillus suaedae]